MLRSYWRQKAREIILRALADLPADATTKEKAKAVRDAYPFGERARWPYKIWLCEVQTHVYGRGPAQRRREHRRQKEIRAGQLSLF